MAYGDEQQQLPPGLLGAQQQESFLTPERQALFGLAGGLLKAGDYAPTPVTLGRIGPAIQGSMDNYRQGVEAAAKMAAARHKGDAGEKLQQYQYAVSQGYKGTFMDFLASLRGGAGEKFGTLVYGNRPVLDKDGNPVLDENGKPKMQVIPMQATKTGGLEEATLPSGVELQAGKVIEVDTAMGTMLVDPLTRQQIGFIPKEVKKAADEAAKGQAIAKARDTLPNAEASAQTLMEQVDAIRTHTARGYGTGKVWGRVPGIAGPQADFVERVEQLTGTVFTNAYETLRGGGAITEAEGLKAIVSRFRANRFKDWDDFNKALEDVERITQRGINVMRRRAEMPDAFDVPMLSVNPQGSAVPGGGSIMPRTPPPPPGYVPVK